MSQLGVKCKCFHYLKCPAEWAQYGPAHCLHLTQKPGSANNMNLRKNTEKLDNIAKQRLSIPSEWLSSTKNFVGVGWGITFIKVAGVNKNVNFRSFFIEGFPFQASLVDILNSSFDFFSCHRDFLVLSALMLL